MHAQKFTVRFLIAMTCLTFSSLTWSACLDSGVQVQVLGSGGPGNSAGRASAGYVIWIDGVGRIMIDAGSGTKDQFHRSGATLEDVELWALSHLHPDHSAELPAILWPAGGNMSLAGPTAGGAFPSISEFLDRVLGEQGAFPILANRTEFEVITVDVSGGVSEVWSEGNIVVRGTGVPHGNVPAIGYRVDVGDASIAFTSDQNGGDPSFIDFIQAVDVLVIHMAATEESGGIGTGLHAKPSVWGQMAAGGDVGRVLVSHIGTSSPDVLQASLQVLGDNYDGPVTVGEDLLCVEVP